MEEKNWTLKNLREILDYAVINVNKATERQCNLLESHNAFTQQALSQCHSAYQVPLFQELKDLIQMENDYEFSKLDLTSNTNEESDEYVSCLQQSEELDDTSSKLLEVLSEKKRRLEQVQSTGKHEEQQITQQKSKLESQFKILSQLSMIKWDTTTTSNDIKGVVFLPNKKDIAPFNLDKETNSQFFIANFLWDVVGQNHEEES